MNKLKCFVILMIIVALLLPIKITYADAPCAVSLVGNSEFKAGDTINISFKVSNLTASRITAFQGLIKYDKDVFEPVTKSSISGMTVTNYTSSASGDLIIVTDVDNAVTSNGGTIITIPFKVKTSPVITGTTTTIEISGAKVSDGESTAQSITILPKTLTLVVPTTPPTEPPATEPPATEPPATEPPATEPPATEAPETEAPETEPPATETPTVTPATEKPATQAPATNGEYPGDKLPQTGVTIGIITVMSAGIGGAGIALFKYFQYKKILK